MKHLEQTPWFICDQEDTNYCAYVDTDSNYFHAEPILRHLYPNFDEMSDLEKDEALEKVALKYQDIITKHYDNVAQDVFNVKIQGNVYEIKRIDHKVRNSRGDYEKPTILKKLSIVTGKHYHNVL